MVKDMCNSRLLLNDFPVFHGMRGNQANAKKNHRNEQRFYARNQTNIFQLNDSSSAKMINKRILQAFHTLQIKALEG